MTFNTYNTLGSVDDRDVQDNAANLDLAVNSLSQTFVDRFGVTRDTLEGIYQKSAYYRAGTFAAGYTLTNNRQTLAYGNIEYSWSGAFPKVVAAGSTPATSGGIGAGAWVDRTDLMLRSELEIKNANTKTVYVTDYVGHSTDIGMVLNNLIAGISAGGGLSIIIPKGNYTLLTPVVKTLLPNQHLEILFRGATINCATDNHGIKITGNDTNSLHIGGTGKINAAFFVNSSFAIGLGVYGFRFPKSLLIDGAITIGTAMHDMNWRYGFDAGNNDTATFFNLHVQCAQTAPYTQTAIRVFSDATQTTDNRFIACTTGAHMYAVEAYNSRTMAGLEGLQFIDCTLLGSVLVQNLIDPEIYAPPQFWFKGCHVNDWIASNPSTFTFDRLNGVRLSDCHVYTHSSNLAVFDSCLGIDIISVDVQFIGVGGNTLFLAGNKNPCGDLFIEGLRDHTEDPLGAVIVMSDSNIFGITISSAYKNAPGKAWIRNDTNAHWDGVRVSKDLVFGSADSRLLIHTLPGVVGSLDISTSVGSVIELSTTGNISQITGRFPTTLTIIANVPGTQFTHNQNLLLFGNGSVVTATAGAQLTFVYQGGGVYREISRSNPI